MTFDHKWVSVVAVFATLLPGLVTAGHCSSRYADRESCARDNTTPGCAWCQPSGTCLMQGDSCVTPPAEEPLPGEPFFADVTPLLQTNPANRHYGVSVTDMSGDGKREFFVTASGTL